MISTILKRKQVSYIVYLKHHLIGKNAEQKNLYNKSQHIYIGIHVRENKLTELPEHYIHSAAKFYIEGEQGIYPVTSFMELRDIDLTKTL